MTTISFYTLGCRSNQYETDRMARSASTCGYEVVPYPGPADIYVINTCTVTSAAEKKSRHIIRHAKKINKDSKIIVTGCAVERDGLGMEEMDLIIKNKDKFDLMKFLEKKIISTSTPQLASAFSSRKQLTDPIIANASTNNRIDLAKHLDGTRSKIENENSSASSHLFTSSPLLVRSNLMVEDGCENFCSYCIVPYVRGKISSRPMDEIVSEAKQMVKDGVKEIVLTGINLGEFKNTDDQISNADQIVNNGAKENRSPEIGLDGFKVSNNQIPSAEQIQTSEFKTSLPQLAGTSSDIILSSEEIEASRNGQDPLQALISDLPSLIDAISNIDGLLRIRLSSIEPNYINDDLIKAVKENPKVCKHFHIPLQSGDNGILKAMNRNYTANDFLNIANRIKKQIKDAAITTDIIVGFPGESEQAFKNTLKLAGKIGFSRIHIFPYSDRPGTKAQKLRNKIDHKIIDTRFKRLDKLREKLMLKFHRSFKDQAMEVLIEQRDRKTGALEGLTSNYIRVFLCGDDTGDESIGSIISVKFRDFQGENVIARPILV
jgi:threonylcarbamoyladenosine tRNA methylthiotransferase MtaB